MVKDVLDVKPKAKPSTLAQSALVKKAKIKTMVGGQVNPPVRGRRSLGNIAPDDRGLGLL